MSTTPPVWSKACAIIEQALDAQSFNRWIAPISASFKEDGTLSLVVDNDFIKHWIEDNYSHLIRTALQQADPNAPAFALEENPETRSHAPATPLPPRAAAPRPKAVPLGELRGAALDPNFTFENFVTGPSNNFACAAAQQAAENPGRAYNPLLIYGDTGLGKTHLMQAVAHAVQVKNPRAIIYYITCEAMLNDFIECIRNKTQNEFRRRYRTSDLLLVDDIQFLSRSAELQEEFFNTFNALQNEHKQIILTSDQPPNKIAGLEDRLVSRFQQGLTTDIQMPDYATRMAILRNKQSRLGEPIPDTFLDYIAQNITSNVRRLEGALTKLVCYRELLRKPLTMEVVVDQLSGFIAEDQKTALTCQDIQKAVCEEYELRLTDMTSKDRTQAVADPRKLAMYLCRKLTRCSFPEIGKCFDKNHATVVYACKTSADRINTDSVTRRRVEKILSRLGRSFDDLIPDTLS